MGTLKRSVLFGVGAAVFTLPSVGAQEVQPRTHAVVRGDNLWNLAQKYLGNPFLWTELYRINRDVIEDPHWIFPGEVLRLPGAEGAAPTAPTPPAAVSPPVAPQQPPPQAPTEARVAPLETSVFGKVAPGVAEPTTRFGEVAVNAVPAPTVRVGEVIAAPYVDREGGPRGFGRIIKSGDLAGIAAATEKERYQAYDRVFIAPPAGYVAPEGERYLAYRLGPILEDQGQVVIPTGIVQVTRAARTEVAAVALVVKAFTELNAADRLIPIDTLGASTTTRPQRVTNGPTTTLKWIYLEPVVPGVQSFAVLGASSRQGVRLGDEFLVFKPRQKGEDGELDDPEIPISKGQVVRSTPFGATVVFVGVEQPAIKEGMSARVIARMP